MSPRSSGSFVLRTLVDRGKHAVAVRQGQLPGCHVLVRAEEVPVESVERTCRCPLRSTTTSMITLIIAVGEIGLPA